MEGQSPAVSPSGYRALACNPAYRTLLGSAVLMWVGQSLYITILPWLMLDVTGSKSAVGWATTARYLPFLLLAVPSGTLVDRLDRRRLMIAVNMLAALLTVAVPILSAVGVLAGWHALLIAFLLSASGLLYYLARSSILPQIVPKEEIVTANSANVVLVGLAMIAGTALVGPVVQALGLANAFAIHGGTLILSALLLSSLRLPSQAVQTEERQPLSWRDLLEGVSYVWHDPVVRSILLLDALYFVLADGMVMVGVPLFVKDVLHAGPEVYGYIRTAGYAGMLLGALWLGRLGRSLHKERLIVLGWLGYPLFRALAPALVASFFASMIGNLIPTCGASLMQERVPQEVLGRVFGIWNMIAPGCGSFSGMIGGALARVLPATGLVALGAVISCGNALLGRVSALWRRK